LFAALTLQLARMQIVQHERYETQAEENRLRVLPVLPARGLIYDRNGEQLVVNQPMFSAAVVPADVPDEQFLAVVAELSAITGVTPAEIVALMADAQESVDRFSPVVVKQNLDDATAFRLRERQPDLPGVQVLVESARYYPTSDITAHLLGYVSRIDGEEYGQLRDQGYQLNDRLGKTGVELIYEAILRGAPGFRQVEVDAAGREIRTIHSTSPQQADNLVLSIDVDLQRRLTELLQDQMVESDNASAIVMDVRNGEVLAMVSLPAYDNNAFTRSITDQELQRLLNDPAKPLVNHAIAGVYPPGSTFKQITGTAALQEGVATIPRSPREVSSASPTAITPARSTSSATGVTWAPSTSTAP
jgi:penicillin-binding protein 2